MSGDFLKEREGNGPSAERRQDGKRKRTGQKNKKGGRKGESNDSSEIPDIPSLNSGNERAYHFSEVL